MIINVAALQMEVEWGNEEANIENTLKAADDLSFSGDNNIFCFPELFTTGFDYNYLRSRDPALTFKIIDSLAEKAKEKRAYILAGTLPEKIENNHYNTLFVIDPKGSLVHAYRKIHLFPLMDEEKFFDPGSDILVFDTPWGKIGTAVCYDLRFPELFQSMALAGAKIIFVCAQFPYLRIEHWDALLKARAIENQLYIVGVNRIGKDPMGTFTGHTSVYDPLGERIAFGGQRQGWVVSKLDLMRVETVRRELPALFHFKDNY